MTDAKKDKLSLFLFIDAFGWQIRQRYPRFLEGLIQDSKPLETILGYSSACDPSIISGRTPSDHGLWNSYYYDPEGSPFRWTRNLRFLPEALVRRRRVRHQLSKWIAKRSGITGYFQLYNIPLRDLPLFSYAEKKRIWEPRGLPHGLSIFDRLASERIPFHVHDSRLPDDRRIALLLDDIRQQRIEFAYCSLGRLDALMHAEGNDSVTMDGLVKWYDEQIRILIRAAEENYREVSWYLFTDHGMHNVTEAYDLMHDIGSLGLQWNGDYVAFYDSTMARFWFLKENTREVIVRMLSTHPKGRIVSEHELQAFGVYFENGQFGDLVFLMNSGVQIVPSFMGLKPAKGMHGYHPSDPDSLAAISSNRPIPRTVSRIQHIHQLMLHELGMAP